MIWNIVQLDKSIDVSQFDCGTPELNNFLLKYALSGYHQGFNTTYVAIEKGKIIASGYFTLTYAEIRFESLPQENKKGVPRYPLPAIRLARLAVDKASQGSGLGKLLMKTVFEIFIEQSKKIRAFALIVDAKDTNAVTFYQKYGFIQYKDQPSSLFLPRKTIEEAVHRK